MNPLHFLTLIILFAWASFGFAFGDNSKDVEVVGVNVKKKVLDRGERVQDAETSIEVNVRQPGKHILGLAGVKITSFTDDKKTDMAKDQDFGNGLAFPTRFKDGNRISFPVRSKFFAGIEATKLRVKGAVKIRVARGEMSLEEKDIKLQKDTNIKIGPFNLSLCHANIGENETGIALSYSDNIFKSIKFLNEDGVVISSSYRGGGSSGGDSQVYYWDRYALVRKVEQMTVRIVYFNKSETVTVPLDLEVGLGF